MERTPTSTRRATKAGENPEDSPVPPQAVGASAANPLPAPPPTAATGPQAGTAKKPPAKKQGGAPTATSSDEADVLKQRKAALAPLVVRARNAKALLTRRVNQADKYLQASRNKDARTQHLLDCLSTAHKNVEGAANKIMESYEALIADDVTEAAEQYTCLLYTSPSPRDRG